VRSDTVVESLPGLVVAARLGAPHLSRLGESMALRAKFPLALVL